MHLITERKIVSSLIMLLAVAIIVRVIISNIELNRILDAGWAVNINVEPQERALRIIVALILGSIALWSQKGNKITLILFSFIYTIMELLCWIIIPHNNSFYRSDLEIHIIVGIILVGAFLIWIRKNNSIAISMLAILYILSEYLLWYLYTINLKKAVALDTLSPPTLLNNTFYGANEKDVIILGFVILVSCLQVRIMLLDKRVTYGITKSA